MSRTKPRSPKPHHMAFALDAPCPHCTSEWGRPAIDMSDKNAMEYPTFTACARCGQRLSENRVPPNPIPA
jgi:hypothetical protein